MGLDFLRTITSVNFFLEYIFFFKNYFRRGFFQGPTHTFKDEEVPLFWQYIVHIFEICSCLSYGKVKIRFFVVNLSLIIARRLPSGCSLSLSLCVIWMLNYMQDLKRPDKNANNINAQHHYLVVSFEKFVK